ncbi:MAG: hypothetical protein HC819_19770 [Cyclobacteriaceae bacterium]|nr:hypothetical protein [Cyclobacteriaceae bacterium]
MKHTLFILSITLLFFIASCNNDGDDAQPLKNLSLNISGLEDLGSAAIYEGWIMVDGAPLSTGTFSVDAAGKLSKDKFSLNASDLDKATAFILTVEPSPDPSPSPSDVHLIAGDFSGKTADLSVSHDAALGDDFANTAGKYILATPTDGADNNEKSGIWFLSLAGGSPAVGLTLPVLPTGWKYEGWVVTGGQVVTSGKFTEVNMADESAPFSSTLAGPPFPGEDYLINAPTGLSFPTDLSGGTAVISIEPEPDNSPAPFVLKPLVGSIPAQAMDHTTYDMTKNLSSFPVGTASK